MLARTTLAREPEGCQPGWRLQAGVPDILPGIMGALQSSLATLQQGAQQGVHVNAGPSVLFLKPGHSLSRPVALQPLRVSGEGV